MWNYKKLNVEGVEECIDLVNWDVMVNNKSIHKQVSIFNEILLNIFSNFTPNKVVTFDDRDSP